MSSNIIALEDHPTDDEAAAEAARLWNKRSGNIAYIGGYSHEACT